MVNPNSKMTVAQERRQYIFWILMLLLVTALIWLAPQMKDKTCPEACVSHGSDLDFAGIKTERFNSEFCKCTFIVPTYLEDASHEELIKYYRVRK
jgi:hypothetical protein